VDADGDVEAAATADGVSADLRRVGADFFLRATDGLPTDDWYAISPEIALSMSTLPGLLPHGLFQHLAEEAALEVDGELVVATLGLNDTIVGDEVPPGLAWFLGPDTGVDDLDLGGGSDVQIGVTFALQGPPDSVAISLEDGEIQQVAGRYSFLGVNATTTIDEVGVDQVEAPEDASELTEEDLEELGGG
jgi:hypothetical protein